MFKRKSNTSKAGGWLHPRGWLRAVRTRQREKGQGFVELGLSLIFLIILLSVVIDLGWAFFTMIALRDSVQEGSSAAAICPTSYQKVLKRFRDSATSPIDMSKLENNLIEFRIYNLDAPTTSLCEYKNGVATPSGWCTGTWADTDPIMVEMKVTYYHDIVTPLIGQFIGNKQQYPLSASAVSSVLTKDCRIKD